MLLPRPKLSVLCLGALGLVSPLGRKSVFLGRSDPLQICPNLQHVTNLRRIKLLSGLDRLLCEIAGGVDTRLVFFKDWVVDCHLAGTQSPGYPSGNSDVGGHCDIARTGWRGFSNGGKSVRISIPR